MAPFHLLRLSPDDLTLMRQLNLVFGRAFEDPGSYHDAPPSDEYLRQWLGRDHVVVLAALQGETVIGGLVAYELDKFERARREIYLYDLAVEDIWRRRGVATGLIGRLAALGKERNAAVVFVQAVQGDDPAIQLYEKLGARENVLHFDIQTGLDRN